MAPLRRDPETCILAGLLEGDEKEAEPARLQERRWQWARPQVEGQGPCARGGHTATLVGPLDQSKATARVFVFGGHFDNGTGKGFSYLNDTHVLDIDDNRWSQARCRGTAPLPRYAHSAALVGSRIVYFGGRGAAGPLRDLHALDAAGMTWYQGPSSGGAPSARQGHSATLQAARMFVFGGTDGARYFGDLHCLDLGSMAWVSPRTTGPSPSPRTGHAALLVGESLLIHGGFCLDTTQIAGKDNCGDLLKNCYLNDIRVLDVNRLQWSRLRTHGSPPVGRFGHSLVLTEDDVLCFGGWSGSPKDPLPGASLREAVGERDELPDDDETCDYCTTLRTADMSWMKNKYIGEPACMRYGHTATAIGPHVIILGGWDGGKPLADVVVLRDRSAAAPRDLQPFDDDAVSAAALGDEEDFVLESGEA